MKIQTYIFSYNRPHLLYANAAELGRISDVTVIDDSSDFKVQGYPAMVMAKHGGKEGFLSMWNVALSDAKKSDADVFIFSPDDVGNWDLLSTLLLVNRLESTSAPWAINFLRDQRDANWNGIEPIDSHIIRQVPTQQVGFCDCALIISRQSLDLMKWHIGPKSRGNSASSGVGRWLTDALHEQKIPIYRPVVSFCDHLGNDCSVMHPTIRPIEPIHAMKTRPILKALVNDVKIPITANLATYPAREQTLRYMLNSIFDKFDRIRICLNGYKTIPSWLDTYPGRDKMYLLIPENDLTDNGKFYWLDELTEPEYYFMMDDDIVYPPDYVDKTMLGLDEYGVVTHHGRNLNPKAKSYYRGGHEDYRCTKAVMGDHIVHVGGTGVMAIDTRVFHPKDLAYHRMKCMADLVFAHAAAEAQVPIRVLDHNGQWIQLVQPHPVDTIADRFTGGDQDQWQMAQLVLSLIDPAAPVRQSHVDMALQKVNDSSSEPLPQIHTILLWNSNTEPVCDSANFETSGPVTLVSNSDDQFPRNRWYEWWQEAFNAAKEQQAEAYAFLPSEINWDAEQMLQAISLMPKMAWALNPINDGRACLWGDYRPSASTFNASIERINFVTDAVIISQAAMVALQWKMPVIPKEWHTPGRSSGIGYHITQKLRETGVAIYRPEKSLN